MVILLFFALASFSQNRKLSKGLELYEEQNYVEAIHQLIKAKSENEKSYTRVKYIANAYRKLKQYDKAEQYYVLSVNSDSSVAEDHLYFGQVLKANGKLSAAKNQFQLFSDKSNNEFLGNIMLQSIDEVEVWESQPKEYKVESSSELNSRLSEYGLIQFQNKYLFTSNRDQHHDSPESTSQDGNPFYSIYEFDTSAIRSNGKGKIKYTSGSINSRYHDGPLTINEQETKLMITRIDNQMRGKGFVNRMKIFEAEFIDGKWKNFQSFQYNSDSYSVCHAHLADSGKTLYFASDMPGGEGGFDIYLSRFENNAWSKPENLGKSINTYGNEVFPHFKNGTLYFSSDGFPGFGELDIFFSQYSDGWLAAENMKSPINSNRDDFSLYYVTDSTGFYASNREGGKGGDDIYQFKKQAPEQLVEVHGLFEFEGLPAEKVKVLLVDRNDSIIAIEYTDREGRFVFSKLPYNNDYKLRVDEIEDEVFQEGRLFLTDQLGNKLLLLQRIQNGDFEFKALPFDEIQSIALQENEDIGLGDGFKFLGRIYKKLPGEATEEIMVYLTNEEGEIIDSTLTDPRGLFQFEKLSAEQNFTIRLKDQDPDVMIALENDLGRVYDIIEYKDGAYTATAQIDPTKYPKKAKNTGYTAILGRLQHQGKPIPFTKVNIYDQEGNYIGSTFTNGLGEFQYNKLIFDFSYIIEFPELDEDVLFESLLYVIDTNGDPLYLVNQLKDGKYTFSTLPFDEYILKKEKEQELVPHIIKIAGQVYKKLPGDAQGGLTIYALDENGLIVDSVITDANGKFDFEKLNSEKNYAFRLKEEGNYNMSFLDDDDKVLELATINKNGNFTYEKLTYQIAQFEPLEEVDVQLIEDDLTHEIMGQVYQKLPGDFKAGMKVFVYDEDGNLLGITETDEDGKFHFKKLKKDQNFFFKIEDEDDHFQLVTLDEYDRVIDKTIKNKFGQFKYSSLTLDANEVLLAEERDHHILDLNIERQDIEGLTINYRFDSVEVRPIHKGELLQLIKDYKDAPYMLEVHSYTDNRGSKEYNIALSKKRTDKVIRFLVRNGFPREQIVGNYSGMLNPVVDCDLLPCDNDDHFKNRRTEFKLLKTIHTDE